MSVEERFWEKVDAGDPDECWVWTGYRNPEFFSGLTCSKRRHPRAPGPFTRLWRWLYA
jgi:hypothetical protein